MPDSTPSADPQAPLSVRIRIGAGRPPGSGATTIERAHDLTVRAAARTTVEEVVDLADLLVPSDEWAVVNLRSLAVAEPHERFAVLAPIDGDQLLLTDRASALDLRARRPTIARPVLEIVAGPDAGGRHALRGEQATIGRDDHRADVAIADPSLSRRHLRIEQRPGGWFAEDLGSRNGTAVDGAALVAGRPVPVHEGSAIEAGRTILRFRLGDASNLPATEPRADGTVPFNRPPRMAPAPFDQHVTAPIVPKRPRGPRLPLVAALVPVIGGVLLWRLTGQTLMLLFCVLAPLMAIGTYVSDRLGGRAEHRRARREFHEELGALAPRLEQLRTDEHEQRLDLFPAPREIVRRLSERDRRLWERRPAHHDDLHVRLGLATLPSEVVRGDATADGDPQLLAELDARAPQAPPQPSTPVAVDLRRAAPLGVAGPPAVRDGVLRWLVLQLAALHSPRDVRIVALVGERGSGWDWLKWLPHVPAAGAAPGGAPAIAVDRAGVAELVDGLTDLVADRSARDAVVRGQGSEPRTIVLVLDDAIHDRAQLAPLLGAAAREAGVHVLLEAETLDALPGDCRTVLELEPQRAVGRLRDTVDRSEVRDIGIDSVPLRVAEDAVAAIAPVRDVTHADRGASSLPHLAPLLELEALRVPTAETVSARWARSTDTLDFVVGAGPDGPLELDLVLHGPHALVGGTSGAGKSEFLRGALASLALRHPPEHLTFLLVDYKGGSAFRELAELPHTVGVVTDLDEHLAGRALTSLLAEIRYREGLLAEHGALDLADLRVRRPQAAPPRLLIAIDEFATLAQEVPGFVDGVLDVVQRGRSLGVHLVLATQSPRGSVTGKIRANTALTIALRTLSREESNDLLGGPEAASIPKRIPGRAWALLGHDELVPFQSGWVGGAGADEEELATAVERFSVGGPGAAAGRAGADETDLQRLVAAARAAHATGGFDAPRRPWLPELPEALPAEASAPAGWLGIGDDPGRQQRFAVAFEPARDGNALVLGGPRSGRTSTLAATAVSLAVGAGSEPVHVYGLDCSGRALAAVEALPHCGAVVAADDATRTTRLLEVLTEELATRRSDAARLGAADLAELRERSGRPELPRILLLVDDIGAFYERYERVELGRLTDLLRQLLADGPAFGIHGVLTADRRFAVPNAIHAVVGMRLVLRMGDRDEYERLGLPRSIAALELPPGRGFDLDGLEVQLANWARTGESLREAMLRLGAEMGEPAGGAPVQIRLLPEQVSAREIEVPRRRLQAAIGPRERDLATAVTDLERAHFLVAGPYRSGRSTALHQVAASLVASTPELETHLVTLRPTPLERALPWHAVHRQPSAQEFVTFFDQLVEAPAAPRLVVIDDATELEVTMVGPRLEAAVRTLRDRGCTLLVGGELQAMFVAFGWLRELRKDGRGLLLAPNMELHGEILGTKLPFRRALEFPPGRGFLVHPGGGHELVQVARPA